MKRKVLYVGHAFHVRTRSVRFFLDILETTFDVTTLNIDPDSVHEAGRNITAADYDIVVILQMDFLAPVFLAKGMPTVVVPMFDGSANMPEAHWQLANQARFIAFSRLLHVKLQRAGNASLLVKFFPEVPSRPARRIDKLKGFFWERRPDSPINVSMVARLAGKQLDALHIHQAPDIPWSAETNFSGFGSETEITTSTWFENPAELNEILSASNVYFAPRLSEGIGMGFLEAMAAGMLVVAHDDSTHNEYVANWHSGILYGLDIPASPHLDGNLAYEIGSEARETVADGRRLWLSRTAELIDWIDQTPKPSVTDIDFGLLETEIPRAYGAGFGSYLQYLRRNTTLVRKMSPALDDKRNLGISSEKFADDEDVGLVPRLATALLAFGLPDTRPFLTSGWSHDESGFVWIDGSMGVMRFASSETVSGATALTVTCHAPSAVNGQTVAIVVNGALCGSIDVGAASESHTVPLPSAGLKRFNELRFFASQVQSGQPDSRALSLAVSFLEFS